MSGVEPQGSVLGPILFLIYINDLEDDISSKVLKFADDTKIFRKVTNDTDKQSLQDDLDKLVKWSEKWQILLNFGKCKCIHIGYGNMDEEYKMGDAVLGRTTQEKDLEVTFSADMKVSEQCGIAASKGNQILGLIRRTIMYKEKQLIVSLYKAIVRPHLEYCIQAWRPYRKKDIGKLERIQRRATKMIPELRDLSYESHLLQRGLTTLRLIKDHMVEFLVKHKLLNSSQHGFLKARSCLTNMLCFLEEITKWIDVGSPVDIIYLDFQKAFDKVPHQRLLLKLKAHGIGDSITDWIEQWLTDRRQRVVVDGEVSNWKSVLSGVPQGSVLGPILFLIYINDLDDSITSNVLKFADDTKLFRKVNTDGNKQHLQNDLDRLVKWSEKWQMLFNFWKCKCLHTGHRNLNVNYKMGDTVLGTTVKEKDLGVTISADMKVSEQCGIAASKGNQILGLIRRNITYKEKKLIIPLYKAIVRPHLEYCIQAWRPYRKKDIDTLERIQRRATKIIPELRDLSYEERLKECGLTTLETRRLRGDQIEVFKILNGYENIDRNMFFSLKKDSRTRGHEVKLVKDQM